MPVIIALPLHVYSSLIASQNEEFKRYETFQTPAASRRTISRAARSCSSADSVPNFFGAGRRLGASLLIKPTFLHFSSNLLFYMLLFWPNRQVVRVRRA